MDKVINQGNMDAVDKYIAEELVEHDPVPAMEAALCGGTRSQRRPSSESAGRPATPSRRHPADPAWRGARLRRRNARPVAGGCLLPFQSAQG